MSTRSAFVSVSFLALGCLPALIGRADSPGSTLDGVWTPPAASYTAYEINRMPDVLLLKAGTKLPISLKTSMTGVWTAEYGVIDAHGNYEAPPYIPEGGDDKITFTHGDNRRVSLLKPGQPLPTPQPLPADYTVLTLEVRIVPNPAIPGSGATPYIVPAPVTQVYADGGEQRLGDDRIVFPKQFSLPPAKFLRTEAVLEPGETLPVPTTLTRTRPAAFSPNKGAYVLPAHNLLSDPTDALRVRVGAVSFVPQRAKELPQLPGSPDTDPDPRMDTRPDVRKAIADWQASQAKIR